MKASAVRRTGIQAICLLGLGLGLGLFVVSRPTWKTNLDMLVLTRCVVRNEPTACNQARNLSADSKSNLHVAARIALYDHKWSEASCALNQIPDREDGLYTYLRSILETLPEEPSEESELAWEDHLFQTADWPAIKSLLNLDTEDIGRSHLTRVGQLLSKGDRGQALYHFRRAVALVSGEEVKVFTDDFCRPDSAALEDISSGHLTLDGEPVTVYVDRSLFEVGCGAFQVSQTNMPSYDTIQINLAPNAGFELTPLAQGEFPFGYFPFYAHQSPDAWSVEPCPDAEETSNCLCLRDQAGFKSFAIPVEETTHSLLMSAKYYPQQGGSAFVGIVWESEDGAQVGTSHYLAASVMNSWWHTTTKAFQPPSRTKYARIVLLNPAKAGRVCFDDLLLMPTPSGICWDASK